MPQIAPQMPEAPEMTPNRVRWTVSQCQAIEEAGILMGRYELIDGEILSKMSQKPPHRIAVILLRNWLIAVFGALFVQSQASISVGDADPDHNEPEPDAAVTVAPNTDYTQGHPGPADLSLVAEVSDTTLRSDRAAKAALYARAGIVEYWLLDIVNRQMLVHRNPGAGGYGEVVVYAADETAATLARPDASVRVADLLPPVAA